MLSIRKVARRAQALGGALLLMSGGCQHYQESPPETFNQRPLIIDEAIQKREWEKVPVYYADTATIAGPRGFNYEPAGDMPDFERSLWEPILFVGQTFWLPIDLAVNPQWTSRAYRPLVFNRSYTAMPPLLPEVGPGIERAPTAPNGAITAQPSNASAIYPYGGTAINPSSRLQPPATPGGTVSATPNTAGTGSSGTAGSAGAPIGGSSPAAGGASGGGK